MPLSASKGPAIRAPLRLLSNGMILFTTLGLASAAHAEITFSSSGSYSSDPLLTGRLDQGNAEIRRSDITIRDLEESFKKQKEDQQKIAGMQKKLEEQERALKDLRGSSSSRSLEELERKVETLSQLERKLDDQARTIDTLKRELEQLGRRVN